MTTKNTPIILVVEDANRKKFELSLKAIHSFIANHENIPTDLVNSLLEQILHKQDYEFKKFSTLAKKKSQYVIDFINKNPGYNFNFSFKELNKIQNKSLELEKFIEIMLHSYFQYEEENDQKCSKDVTIAFFHNALTADIDIECSSIENKWSEYKKAVLCGIFTIASGNIITTKKNPKPKDVFQAVQHAIKKSKQSS